MGGTWRGRCLSWVLKDELGRETGERRPFHTQGGTLVRAFSRVRARYGFVEAEAA